MRITTLLLFAGLLLGTSACHHYKYIKASTTTFKPVRCDDVTLFTDKDKVPAGATDVGLIICKSNKEKKIYKKARGLSAAHGANGMYMQSGKDITAGQKFSNFVLGSNFKGKYVFVAVHY